MIEGTGKKEPVIPLDPLGLTSITAKSQGKTSDSIAKSGGSSGSGKTVDPASPDLLMAQYILWFGNNNQMAIQLYSGKAAGDKIENLNPKLVSLQFENDMHAIAISVLNAWSQSIHQQVEANHRKEKSDRIKDEDTNKELRAHDVLQNVISQQRTDDSLKNLNVTNIEQGHGQGLNDYLSKLTAGDPNFAVPAMSGIAMSIVSQNNPMSGGSIINQVAPSYSVDLTTLSALFVSTASHAATMQTILSPVSPPQKIDHEFAKNYAHQILKELSSADFNSWAMAIVTHGMAQLEQIDPKEADKLVVKLKLAMLSTALALLYQTDRGIDGDKFVSLMVNEVPKGIPDINRTLLFQVQSLYKGLPKEDQTTFLAAASSWIDETSKENLMRVSPLFNAMQTNAFNDITHRLTA